VLVHSPQRRFVRPPTAVHSEEWPAPQDKPAAEVQGGEQAPARSADGLLRPVQVQVGYGAQELES